MYTNKHEIECYNTIKEVIPKYQPYLFDCDKDELLDIRINNNPKNEILLFREQSTGKGNTTETGRGRRKEFMIYFPITRKKVWIEVRYLHKPTMYQDFTYGEIIRSETYEGDLWLVLLGEGFNEKILNLYENEIQKRGLFGSVKLIRNMDELKILLKDEIILCEMLV